MKPDIKLREFQRIARELNDEFQTCPILYGSLGLSVTLAQNLNPDDIDILIDDHGARYRVLNTEQFLATYEASSLDGYRRDTHAKNDAQKIALIKTSLSHKQREIS